MSGFTESVVEEAALAWLQALAYGVLHGPDIAAGEPAAERSDTNYRDVLLAQRLRKALVRLNPDLPPEAIEDAFRKLTRADGPSLVEGVAVEYRRKDGFIVAVAPGGKTSTDIHGCLQNVMHPHLETAT